MLLMSVFEAAKGCASLYQSSYIYAGLWLLCRRIHCRVHQEPLWLHMSVSHLQWGLKKVILTVSLLPSTIGEDILQDWSPVEGIPFQRLVIIFHDVVGQRSWEEKPDADTVHPPPCLHRSEMGPTSLRTLRRTYAQAGKLWKCLRHVGVPQWWYILDVTDAPSPLTTRGVHLEYKLIGKRLLSLTAWTGHVWDRLNFLDCS